MRVGAQHAAPLPFSQPLAPTRTAAGSQMLILRVSGIRKRLSRNSAIAGASRDEALAAPLLEDLLGLLVYFVQRLLGAQAPRRRVGEHGGKDEGVEDLAFRGIGRSRVPDVRRPLQGRGDRLELGRRVRAERVVRRGLLQPL